jgi:hypothetical protein
MATMKSCAFSLIASSAYCKGGELTFGFLGSTLGAVTSVFGGECRNLLKLMSAFEAFKFI